MKPLTDVYENQYTSEPILIYMCAKFGSRSFKIATKKVNHRISARCIWGVAMAFRSKNQFDPNGKIVKIVAS